jgi:hypothetical protein
MQFEFAVETQKVRKREQKHQKAGYKGQSSNFLINDLLRISLFLDNAALTIGN